MPTSLFLSIASQPRLLHTYMYMSTCSCLCLSDKNRVLELLIQSHSNRLGAVVPATERFNSAFSRYLRCMEALATCS